MSNILEDAFLSNRTSLSTHFCRSPQAERMTLPVILRVHVYCHLVARRGWLTKKGDTAQIEHKTSPVWMRLALTRQNPGWKPEHRDLACLDEQEPDRMPVVFHPLVLCTVQLKFLNFKF
jgi:hypothetical protein